MNKNDSSSDEKTTTEVITTEPDPVQIGGPPEDGDSSVSSESEAAAAAETGQTVPPAATSSGRTENNSKAGPKPRRAWFSLFNFLLILVLASAAGYYWWQQQQVTRDSELAIAELRQQLETRASNTRLEASLSPLKGDISSLGKKLESLDLGQQGLRESGEKLYALFGRDRNAWQLAEVEYLMRVAQHKLILQDDFEGAAITLQAASDRIGLTGDPGLLPVRVMISEEIAELKTRKRADLVGMTLILAQLGRQLRVLEPGFAVRVDDSEPPSPPQEGGLSWLQRFKAFIESLVSVRNEVTEPSAIEANTADVSERLEDNLKLARWAVLDRDARQYGQLIDQSLRLFREFYDLDNAANSDFFNQLQELQKMVLKPDKPEITGSLRELQRILSQRENSPQESPVENAEADNG